MAGPLAGIRVIDMSEGAQGPWAGALLSDLGADVIKVEKPEGEMMRNGGPTKRGYALPNMGLNHGKRNISLNLKEQADREILHDLVRTADVFLENWRRGVAERLDVDYETLSTINPRLVYASASGFGIAGKYAHKATVDNISQAMAGYFSLNGPVGGKWERPRFIVIDLTSPLTVVQAIIMGLLARQKTGWGQWVRCSQLETLMALSAVRAAEYFATDEAPQPMGSGTAYIVPGQAFRTADGYVMVECVNEDQWRHLCEVLQTPDLANDARFATNADRVTNRDVLTPILEAAFLRYTTHRWVDRLTAAEVPCNEIVWDIEDIYDDPQVVANGLLVKRARPEIGWVRTTEVPWLLSDTPAHYDGLAVPLDHDRESVMEDIRNGGPVDVPTTQRKVEAPLLGMRVLDLTEGDGAPFAAMQLGDAGAEVIKVERTGGDWARSLGGAFDHGDGPLFMGMNRNKRSIAIDLEQPQGRELVQRLALGCDVVIHSFAKADDARRLGLDYETLSAQNPRLVYCDISTLERSGPDADRPATDGTVQARAGLPRFLGSRGGEPLRFGSNYAGVTAALYAVQGILAALYIREQTGRGQSISTSYLRAMIATQTNYFTAFSEPDPPAPSGFYTAHMEPPGHAMETTDQPIHFTLGFARDPQALLHLLERLGVWDEVKAKEPDLATRPLTTADSNRAMPYIKAAIKHLPSLQALAILEEIGLMCSPVHDYESMFNDPGVLEQEMLVTVDHPVRGATKQVGMPWKMTDAPTKIRLAPPILGEHTDEVLAGVGCTTEQISALRTAGVIR